MVVVVNGFMVSLAHTVTCALGHIPPFLLSPLLPLPHHSPSSHSPYLLLLLLLLHLPVPSSSLPPFLHPATPYCLQALKPVTHPLHNVRRYRGSRYIGIRSACHRRVNWDLLKSVTVQWWPRCSQAASRVKPTSHTRDVPSGLTLVD